MKRLTFVVGFALLAGRASAQTGELFLTSFNTADAYVVQGGQIVRQFLRNATSDGPALVVQGTVKMYGQAGGSIGHEYSLSGTLLAGQYPNPGFVDCYDGATDGTRNWTISHNDFSNNFADLVGDANWGGVQVAFVPNRRSSGIAYDATDDTLWIANNVGGSDRVQHYSTGGALLGEFPVGLTSGGGYGIALDPADQTLWLPGAFGTQGLIVQYSKAGVLLQSLSISGLNTSVLGAEFQTSAVPVSYCTAGTTTNGCLPAISGAGTPSASASSGFTISASAVEGGQQGVFFYGVAGRTLAQWGPSSSFFCVKVPVQRMSIQSTGGSSGACDGTLSVDWNAYIAATPLALGAPFSAGQMVNAQAWFRDPPSPKTTMLSDALEFIVQP